MKYLLVIFLIFGCKNLEQSTISFTAKVVAVKDGDTIEVLYQGKTQTIRLLDIDCPERRQDFGEKAKQFTANLCFGKLVSVIPADKPDRYQRMLATVFVGKLNLNEELVRAGFAWHFKKYSNNQIFATLENRARQKEIGLWIDKRPIPPWDFRNGKQNCQLVTIN